MPTADPEDARGWEPPPVTVLGILRRLGPGLIVAGSIVGSGELIATTKTGAEAGFWLLWLILLGCVIKVFLQIEFGRYTITHGVSTMVGLNSVPGPVLELAVGRRPGAPRLRGNWIVWFWFLVWLASVGQLGGIVGGVGQALAISLPLTARGRDYNAFVEDRLQEKVVIAEQRAVEKQLQRGDAATAGELRRLGEELAAIRARIAVREQAVIAAIGERTFRELGERPPAPPDDRIWAAIVTVITAGLLIVGRYGLIQHVSTFLVSAFTLTTIINVALLQTNSTWAVTADDLIQGLSFRLPPHSDTALATALAAFGIIGVGATEIVFYPYWCLEKGYARFTGPRDDTASWAERARGWMRVLHWDAWIALVLYTFATMAFYLLGAAILGRTGLNPAKSEMVRTLQVMYEPVFGQWAWAVFFFGAFAVLYSTFFVANASHARVFSDTIAVLGLVSSEDRAHRRRVAFFSGCFPLLCLLMYVCFPEPARLVLISGIMQAIMLPMLAAAGLYFRYRQVDPRLRPGPAWDALLWLSAAGMFVAGVWALVSEVQKLLTTG